MANNEDTTGSEKVIDCIREMQSLAGSHPDWWASYEDAQVDVGCERQVLMDLLSSAPTDLAKGVVFGRILFRQQVASLTGRPF